MRAIVARRRAEENVAQVGAVIASVDGRAMMNPYVRRAEQQADRVERLRKMLGAAPLHRLRFAPLLKPDRDSDAWKDFD